MVNEMNSGKNEIVGANDSAIVNEEEGEGWTMSLEELLQLFDERLDTNTIKSSRGRVALSKAFVGVDRGDVGGIDGMP